MKGKTRLFGVSFALVIVLAAAGVAWGHAHLNQSVPAAGAELTTVPTEVCLRFSEAVESVLSKFEVLDAEGRAVHDAEALKSANRGAVTDIRIPLQEIGPGTYKVVWQVLSIDTHTSRGEFSFTVLAGAQPVTAGENGAAVTACHGSGS